VNEYKNSLCFPSRVSLLFLKISVLFLLKFDFLEIFCFIWRHAQVFKLPKIYEKLTNYIHKTLELSSEHYFVYRLNIDFVDCHSNIGVGRGSPEVIDGVLVQTSVDNMMMLQKFPGRQYRALVVY
jgi:hypothetical protein